jgi:hypothetical protein
MLGNSSGLGATLAVGVVLGMALSPVSLLKTGQTNKNLIGTEGFADVENQESTDDLTGIVLRLLHLETEGGQADVDNLMDFHGGELGHDVNLATLVGISLAFVGTDEGQPNIVE